MVVPTAMRPFAGRIEIESKVGDWTLTDVLPVIELEVAEIESEPRARAAANPPPLIDAMLWFEELQVTVAVMSFVRLIGKCPDGCELIQRAENDRRIGRSYGDRDQNGVGNCERASARDSRQSGVNGDRSCRMGAGET